MRKTAKKPRNKWTQWFVKIIEFILRNYKVEIIPEYQLYKEPMRIDIVVVKLLEDIVINNPVMEFFKKHNIIEFKGPTDILSIEAFDRVLSYFYAYLSKNSINFSDVTITFISVKKPEKLLDILKNERGYKIISSKNRGIYYIKSSGSTPVMQLVINSQLSVKDGVWLMNSIRDNWTVQDGAAILKKYEDTQDFDLIREVMHELCTANINIMEEVEEMTVNERKARNFLKGWSIKSGWAQTWKQEGRQEGRQEGVQQLFEFLSSGHSLSEAKKKFAFA